MGQVEAIEVGVVTAAVRGLADAFRLLGEMHEMKNAPGVLERFVLEWATDERRGSPLPKGIRRGLPRQCFKNATDLMFRRSDFEYHEGYALAPGCGGFPIHHAWVVDGDGNVVDSTWSDPEDCFYLGVRFSKLRVCRAIERTETYGVLCPNGFYATDLMAGYASGDR